MRYLVFIMGIVIASTTAYADNNRLHIYAGQYTASSMGDTILSPEYESQYLIAMNYRRFITTSIGITGGAELGTAARFGMAYSQEFWVGLTTGYAINIGRIRITPSITGGLSFVTDSSGEERQREESNRGDASLLFYLAPEIELSWGTQWSIIYRLHHRSGANRTLGGLCEGYNANTIGIGYKF